MLVIYPMLISKSVSENIVPGLVKTVESYIVVNMKDGLLTSRDIKKNLNFKIKSGKIIATENVDLTEGKDSEFGGRTKLTPKEKEANRKLNDDIDKAYKQNEDDIKDRLKRKNEEAQAKIDQEKEAYEKREKELEDERARLSKKAWDDLEKRDKELARINKQIKDAGETREQILKQIEVEKKAAAQEAADEVTAAEAKAAAARKEARADAELVLKHKKFEDEKKERERKQIEDKKNKAAEELEKQEKKAEEDARAGVSSIKVSDNKALSIEPTTVDVEYTDRNGNRKPFVIGVKVVPFRVKSEAKLSRLIMHDTNLKWFNATMVSWGRKITKKVWRFIDRWAGNLKLGGLIPSGDPRRDIVMSRTGYNAEGGYIVLSKSEDIDEAFLNNAKKINRLYKMGWGNIIIVDNVNRMAYFCLKQFRGVCTALSFSMIYHNFKALQVYDSLEDASRQTSSIFKIRKKFSSIIAESIVEYKLEKYLSEDK